LSAAIFIHQMSYSRGTPLGIENPERLEAQQDPGN